MNIYDLLKEKRAEIFRTAAGHDAYTVRIFGSVARNEADAASDLDFLVEMEPGRSLLDLGDLLMDLLRPFGLPRGRRDRERASKANPGPGFERSCGAMRDDQRRLLDIAEAIEQIEKYASKGRKVFEGDELIQNWIVHHLQVIGEAAWAISSELKDEHDEMPWQQIVGMRNILVHRYFEVDTDLIRSVVEDDMPVLKQQVELIFTELEEEILDLDLHK